jgi:hypothetical protein
MKIRPMEAESFHVDDKICSLQFFEKSPNIKFHENPSNGSRVVTCGQGDGHTGLTKTTAAFHNFATARKTTQTELQSTEKVSGEYRLTSQAILERTSVLGFANTKWCIQSRNARGKKHKLKTG